MSRDKRINILLKPPHLYTSRFLRPSPSALPLRSQRRTLINGEDSFGEDEPFRVTSDILGSAGGHSVVSLPEAEAEELDEQLNSGPAEQEQQIITPDDQPGPEIAEAGSSQPAPVPVMEIPDGDLADDKLPQPDELPAAVASAKKRGRPSATPARTSAKAKTPRATPLTNGHATASRATSGRKRKAEDEPLAEATPAKRGRPSRSAAVTASARLAAKDVKKAKPGRPKGSGTVSSGDVVHTAFAFTCPN